MARERTTHNLRRPLAARTAPVALTIAALALLPGCGGGSKSTTASTPVASTSTEAPPATHTSTQPTTGTQPATTASTANTASTPSKAPERAPPNERIEITSPAIHNGLLPARYTCDGSDTPLPLHWKGVPAGTAELMLDIIKVKPVNNKLYFPWAVTHIKPSASGSIVQGKLPPGAVVGTNGEGKTAYHLCPPKGPSEAFVAVLFALPHKLAASTGFDPQTLRLQAEKSASYQNLYIFSYTRP
jgi:phosphatidylethanolamine-binding protein (PEBP) family uncharacterized protein